MLIFISHLRKAGNYDFLCPLKPINIYLVSWKRSIPATEIQNWAYQADLMFDCMMLLAMSKTTQYDLPTSERVAFGLEFLVIVYFVCRGNWTKPWWHKSDTLSKLLPNLLHLSHAQLNFFVQLQTVTCSKSYKTANASHMPSLTAISQIHWSSICWMLQ